jgi:hypothetical protein
MPEAVQNMDVETIDFSEPEIEVLQERMRAYHEAVDAVNKWMAFLMKQHNVAEGVGWQLDERGFMRQKAAPPEPAVSGAAPTA